MPSATIVGLQWGDEGKGKILDVLASNADLVARFQGGGNAGHTVVAGGTKYVFHLIPTGILHPDVTCVIGNGAVIDVVALQQEIQGLEELNVSLRGLKVASRAHVVFPYHKALDEAREIARTGADKIGTTKRGIGPCYADKASRTGIRIADLFDPKRFGERLRRALDEKNAVLTQLFRRAPLEFEPILRESLAAAAVLRPFVTSSNTWAAGVSAGAGVPPKAVGRVLGITKAYTTRVGAGPFPTELSGEPGDRLREKGHEFGATTGRPRRCGWLDLPQLRYAVRLCGVDGIVLTKLDTLSGYGPLQVCVGYELAGEPIRTPPADADDWGSLRCSYEELTGIPADVDWSSIRSYDAFPAEAKAYVSYIEERLGVPVSMISIGPEREAIVQREDIF